MAADHRFQLHLTGSDLFMTYFSHHRGGDFELVGTGSQHLCPAGVPIDQTFSGRFAGHTTHRQD
jgi:hypothetical protein